MDALAIFPRVDRCLSVSHISETVRARNQLIWLSSQRGGISARRYLRSWLCVHSGIVGVFDCSRAIPAGEASDPFGTPPQKVLDGTSYVGHHS